MIEKLIPLFKKLVHTDGESHILNSIILTIPRITCGYLMAVAFGGSKFGMPWTDPEQGLALFQVAAWFPKDVAEFGGIFSEFPMFFAWMGAASEAIGGVFLFLGLGTRIASFMILCTMLVAIFCQQIQNGLWNALPALGFLWVALFYMVLGGGKFSLDHLISSRMR